MIAIRNLKPGDVPATLSIIRRSYPDADMAETERELRVMFDEPLLYPPTFIVAIEEGRIVGLAGYKEAWMDKRVYSIFWVNVDPAVQRRGVGKELIRTIIQRCREIGSVQLLQLTTTKPDYYSHNFLFLTIAVFGSPQRHLMAFELT